MLLTRLAFWYLPDPRFTRCLGGFGPKLDLSFGGGPLIALEVSVWRVLELLNVPFAEDSVTKR